MRPSPGPISGFAKINAAPATAPTIAPAISMNKCLIGGCVSRKSRAAHGHRGELDRAAQLAALADARDRPCFGVRAFEPRELVRAAEYPPVRRRTREHDAELPAHGLAGDAAHRGIRVVDRTELTRAAP